MERAEAEKQWREFIGKTPKEQNEILKGHMNTGRLSKVPVGNWSIISDGMLHNPAFTDTIMLYFVEEVDARAFADVKTAKLGRPFYVGIFYAREPCCGKENCKGK